MSTCGLYIPTKPAPALIYYCKSTSKLLKNSNSCSRSSISSTIIASNSSRRQQHPANLSNLPSHSYIPSQVTVYISAFCLYSFADMDCDRVLPQHIVEGMIADGDTIVIFQDYVLRLNGWLHKHPGGSLVIQHMVGRDATDEITA